MTLTDSQRATSDYDSVPQVQPPPPAPGSLGRGYSVAAFICAVVAFLFIPIVFGPLGIALGVVAHRKGDPLGKWAAVTAGALMVAGMVIGAILLSNAS